jgi:hypothetical protein
MATTITKTTNLIKINTDSNLERCYSLTSGYKFAPKTNAPEAVIFTIGGDSFDIICANGIFIDGEFYDTLAAVYPELITYLT